jgi:hypothetical protein
MLPPARWYSTSSMSEFLVTCRGSAYHAWNVHKIFLTLIVFVNVSIRVDTLVCHRKTKCSSKDMKGLRSMFAHEHSILVVDGEAQKRR